jgi:hypothetical protein
MEIKFRTFEIKDPFSSSATTSLAISGPMTTCGAVESDKNFTTCKHCPNRTGECKHLVFGEFCGSIDAQKEL